VSWAKWDAEHRGLNVHIGKSATGGLRVVSGGKHLGNIEHRGGKHIAVVKKGGVLEHTEHDTHEDALNHIRQAHGLSKGGASMNAEAEALVKQHSAKKTSSAEQLAAQIKASLGHTTPAPHAVTESKAKKSTSTVVTADKSSASVVHGLGKPKSKALEKGKKYHSDSIKTKIHIAAWKDKKAAGGGGVSAPKAAAVPKADPKKAAEEHAQKLQDAAHAASAKADKSGTVGDHKAAAAAHNKAADASHDVGMSSLADLHDAQAQVHGHKAQKAQLGEEQQAAFDKALAATTKASSEKTPEAHKAAQAAHEAALKKIKGDGTDVHGRSVYHLKWAGYHDDEAQKLTPSGIQLPPQQGVYGNLSNMAYKATAQANKENTYEAHETAHKVHLQASKSAKLSKNDKMAQIHADAAQQHKAEAEKLHAAPSTSSAAKIAATVTTPHFASPPTQKDLATQAGKSKKAAEAASAKANKTNTAADHQAAYEAHLQAYKDAKAAGFDSWAKVHMNKQDEHYKAKNKVLTAGLPPAPAAKKTTAAPAKKVAAPAAAAPTPSGGTKSKLETAADAADRASREAEAEPTKENHLAAAEAHKAALSASYYDTHAKAANYHQMMQSYHAAAASNPAGLKKPEVLKEHKDEKADLFPPETHGLHVGFQDTASRRKGQQAYDSVTKASATGLSPSERSSVHAYTGSWYKSINRYLRKQDSGTATVKGHVQQLDSAFDKQPPLKDDLITYRGISDASELFGDVGSHVGGEFQDHGYGSSASNAAVTHGFSSSGVSGALVRILHPAGTKVLKPSDVGSFGDSERELLIPRGTKFHVAADRLVTDQNGKTRRLIDLVRKD